MSYTVKVRQFDEALAVETGETILEAALRKGLDYPCGCRSGNCGACKSRLISGEVEMSPHSEFALDADEKDAGLILACRSVPWSDCEVAYLETDDQPSHPLRDLTCRVDALEGATHDIRIVRLGIESGGPFTFSAGQYARLTFGDLPPRDYSMASRPGDEGLEFHVRRTEDGTVSQYVAETLSLSERVRVQGPYGAAHLREDHRGPILALAGGSGLAPVKSIVESALAAGARQPIHLYLGVHDERDVYLEAHFAGLSARHPNLRFTPVLSAPSGPTARRTGLMCDVVAADFADLDGCKAYLAGPPVMVETTVEALLESGLGREDCHADAFYTEAEKAALETET